MYVIGAGFPRTGTMSTKGALEQLGLGPCYHFVTLFERPQDTAVWQAAAEGQQVDWKALFADFRSLVDWPESVFYKQLMDVYPEAKVLLTVRDPEKWYESMRATVYIASRSFPPNAPQASLGRMIDTLAWQGLFHGRFEDKEYAISVFERHNQEVKDSVPADRLLVWEVKEGWAPLCDFLGVAAPDAPFPHLNDAETFRQQFLQARVPG